ncbi:MAG TPA: hypothetical protein VL651_00185 [Bacteroidia bacterium]|jgi:hypothetical protein|nr:hypothetical protein [Bacteroidia bacterium]
MNEPTHAHFILSDAQYCHVLEDRLYVGRKDVPEKFPQVKNSFDGVLLILQVAAFLLLAFFITMTIVVHYYVVTLTLGMLLLLLMVSVIRTLGFTNTKVIMKADILGVDYFKKSVGYDFFVVRYSGEGGKLWKRRLTLYDSQQSIKQALEVMKEAGLLKN